MAKILGIREVLGSGAGLLARDVRGVGFYEASGTVERQFSPYDGIGQSETQPYDLSTPGRVAEVKRVLRALGQHASDPNRNPADPQLETLFQHMDMSPEFIDAWDGSTADTFALTVGRHRHRFPLIASDKSPLMQVNKLTNELGQTIIVGGPQPTVPGLEALALAAHEVLGDSVQLDQYLAWRGGTLECTVPWERCTAPSQIALPTTKKGRDWDPRGWTVAWTDGPAAKSDPGLVNQLSIIDKALDYTWQQAPEQSDESSRKAVADKLVQLRLNRNNLVKQLNAGAPTPTCEVPSQIYDRGQGACVARCPPDKRWDTIQGACVIDLPVQNIPAPGLSAGQAIGMVGLLIGGMMVLANHVDVGGFNG